MTKPTRKTATQRATGRSRAGAATPVAETATETHLAPAPTPPLIIITLGPGNIPALQCQGLSAIQLVEVLGIVTVQVAVRMGVDAQWTQG